MRALLCKELGPAESLAIETVPDPEPGSGEAVVEIHTAGLNFPDTLVIAGKYQIRPELPFVPGGEAAGTICALGEDTTGFAIGDRVMAIGATGAFAEKLCKPVTELIKIPESMSFVTAAGFHAAYGTSYHALKQRAQLKKGETLLVLGAAGGVGLAAVNIGAAMGATVIAAASSEEKLDTACKQGATLRINYSRQSLNEQAKALSDGKGVDVVYDPVGGELAEQALRASAWDGRFLVVGFASGLIPSIPLNLPLLKSSSIIGVFYGAWAARRPAAMRQNICELFVLFESGKISPLISMVFELEQFAEGFATLTGRRAQGKVIFRMRPENQ